LPFRLAIGGGEVLDELGEQLCPRRGRAWVGNSREQRANTVDKLGEAPDGLGVAGVDAAHRQRGAEPLAVGLVGRNRQQQSTDPGLGGALREFADRHPPDAERDHAQHHVEDVVGGEQSTVSEAHAQIPSGVVTADPPERPGDQWREVFDVGAHDQHVAGLEPRVVGEEVQQPLAQDLDLPLPTVAGVQFE